MSFSDPVGDLLTRIRNAQKARLSSVQTPASKLRGNVLDVLKREGYIRDYSRSEEQAGMAEFKVELTVGGVVSVGGLPPQVSWASAQSPWS